MSSNLKRLIGSFLLVALIILWALVVMAIAVARLGNAGTLAQLAFFFFTGILWVLPGMLIIKWMYGAPKKK